MQEGIVFCLTQEQLIDRTYTIPIYLSEDAGLKTRWSIKRAGSNRCFTLFSQQKSWSLEIDQEDLAFGFIDKNVLMLLFLKEHQDIFDGSISKTKLSGQIISGLP